jgi:hypothetical protein
MNISKLTFFTLITIPALSTFACDLCGCYTPRLEVASEKPFSLYFAASEQFTHFGTDRFNGDKVDNRTDQHLDSSITQLVVGATFFKNRFGLQVNVPLIYRSYQRPEGFEIEHGHESGVGDVSVLANWVVFQTEAARPLTGDASKDGKSTNVPIDVEPDFSATLNLIAGLKLPTGDSSRIKEEFNEVEVEGAPESGIHGHDLALGTGSYDGVFGAQLQVRYKALFFQADVQYTWRGQGDYSYRYANDFSWDGGPGVYLIRKPTASLALQCVVSGETKGLDTFQGESALDTGITSLYVGPRVVASFGRVQGEIGVDFPTIMNTTAFQTTADYRIRAGFSVHF